MTDGTGTTSYTYGAVGALGALQLQQETIPLPGSTIGYAYDALGRLVSRTVAGAGAETFGYDAIGRLTTHASDLGSFGWGYLGQTSQQTTRILSGSTLATNWSYLPNAGDRRMAEIGTVGLSTGQTSSYQYGTAPDGLITGIVETSDATLPLPGPGQQSSTLNALNQVTAVNGQALTYDANGNLLSDGQLTYSWDAENRLVGIAYPGQPGKATAFAYDGRSRRTAIASTPAGGGTASTADYVWCGARMCQSRASATNAVLRSYYAEGEVVAGSPAQPLYYGVDQIGSIRRVFASTSSAPAYSYDPFGIPLQSMAPAADFGYAGMFLHADSGLSLTQYRIYNPSLGRWLSRDPLGETTDPDANLYPYVGGNPLSYRDPDGTQAALIVPVLRYLGPPLAYAICKALGGCNLQPPPPNFCPLENAPPDPNPPDPPASEQPNDPSSGPNGGDNDPNPGNLKKASMNDLSAAASADGYDSVEAWKQQELQLDSRSNIVKYSSGNLYSVPRQGGGAPRPLDVRIP